MRGLAQSKGELFLLGDRRFGSLLFLLPFFHQCGALADALAQIGKFGAADVTRALYFYLFHPGRMDRENAFHTFTVADAADGKHFIQSVTAPANDYTGEHLDALLVALV